MVYTTGVILSCLLMSINIKADMDGNTSLKMMFTMFRHGSRSPMNLIPNDPNNELWNEIGIGELTNVGKYQQFVNGQLTKQRYNDFFIDYGNSSLDINIRSTDLARTIMSAEGFAAGIYKPTGNQVWTSQEIGHLWQPTPIYSDLTYVPIGLKKFNQMIDDVILSMNYSAADKIAIDAIANATGLTPNENLVTIVDYVDPLSCEAYLNLTLPFGLNKYENDIYQLLTDVFNNLIPVAYKYFSDYLLLDVLSDIESFNNGSTKTRINVFSIHDIHIASVMAALTDDLVGDPEFSATIYLEVHSPNDNTTTDYLKLWYRPTISSAPVLYYIKDCGYECPYSNFQNIVYDLNNNTDSNKFENTNEV